MVSARMEITDYANRVLNVVKAKFALIDKSAALNKFVELYGDEFVERDVKDDYVKSVVEVEKKHFKKYGKKKMSEKEFDKVFEMN
jgi:hypothetical protein